MGVRDELKDKRLRWGELASFYELSLRDAECTANMTADEKNNLVYKRKTLLPSRTQIPATSMVLRSRQKSAGATSSLRNQINISEDASTKFEPEECQLTTDDFIHYSFQANFSKLVQNADHPTVIGLKQRKKSLVVF